ncbi:FecR family protein [Flavobacterium sp. FlaQc-47]|uniref:FecR family protein n=1 Tax=Flavobacterium sp. FlaQc-47 TaxID=3374180 RepID=UPI003757DC7A
MTKKEIDDLLLKFENNDCTTGEKNLLFQFYDDLQKEDKMASWNLSEKEETRIRLLRRINNSIRTSEEKQTQKISWKKYQAIAAIFICFITAGYLFFQLTKAPSDILPKDAITLQLEDGTIQILEKDGTVKIQNTNGHIVGEQNGNQLTYNKNSSSQKLAYNILRIPNGKTFQLQLSDGTTVHLNAGSSLKYPVEFLKDAERKVFITGEAFLTVSKDAKHPFIVNANNLNVRVLGTQFNVSAYPEDNTTDVVLVEGSVGLYTNNEVFDTQKSNLLKPGFKASYNKQTEKIRKDAVRTAIYTSWMGGELIFRNMTFDNILKKLERHYDITIVNNNKALGNKIFNANFRKTSFKEVFDKLKINYGIEYQIDGNTIIIK